MRTNLYRHFDAQGVLLYVGISLNAVRRLSQHQSDADWASHIVRVDIETFDTRELAEISEKAAIRQEKPIFNIMHNGGRREYAGLAVKAFKPQRHVPEPRYMPKNPEDDVWLTRIEAAKILRVDHPPHDLVPAAAQRLIITDAGIVKGGEYYWLKSHVDNAKKMKRSASIDRRALMEALAPIYA